MEQTWASLRQTSRLWSKNWWPTWTICLGSGERQKVLSCFKGFKSHTWTSSDSSTADDQFLTYRKGKCQFRSCAVRLLKYKKSQVLPPHRHRCKASSFPRHDLLWACLHGSRLGPAVWGWFVQQRVLEREHLLLQPIWKGR